MPYCKGIAQGVADLFIMVYVFVLALGGVVLFWT